MVPLAQPEVDGDARPVLVGWHPVGGFAGKWFAEETGLGRMITERVMFYPDPTQHWAVLVGDYAHQLWMVRRVRPVRQLWFQEKLMMGGARMRTSMSFM